MLMLGKWLHYTPQKLTRAGKPASIKREMTPRQRAISNASRPRPKRDTVRTTRAYRTDTKAHTCFSSHAPDLTSGFDSVAASSKRKSSDTNDFSRANPVSNTPLRIYAKGKKGG